MVVACGGDGSLHLLVERARALGLADRVELGLVPLGTGNDFAGHLGIPTDPDGAAAVLRDGPTTAMDVMATVIAIRAAVSPDNASAGASPGDFLRHFGSEELCQFLGPFQNSTKV